MLISNAREAAGLAWDAGSGLLPAIVQDPFDGRVLMQAWMNREALEHTFATGRVTFWSRSRNALWTKGETSGNFLTLDTVHADCDLDSLLILAVPTGPTCHRETASCFDGESAATPGSAAAPAFPAEPAFVVAPRLAFLAEIERLVAQRDRDRPEGSYTTALFEEGVRRIAQKVGEEGVETALAAVAGDETDLCNESADLLFHLLVLLRSRNVAFHRVIDELMERHGSQRRQ